MHPSSLLRMEWFCKNYVVRIPGRKLKVLDVGSYVVNGSYRKFFPSSDFEYTGLDMASGPNVDVVPAYPYDWRELDSDTFDVVISGQALEHAEFFWITMCEMVRVLKKDGMLCLIVPNGFKEHRHPVDCWRFFTDGLVALARYTSVEVVHTHTNCAPEASARGMLWVSDFNADSMLIAKKPYSGITRVARLYAYTCKPANHSHLRKGMLTAQEVSLGLNPKVI